MAEITGILLAAGASSRFGCDKLVTPIPGHESMLIATSRPLIKVLTNMIAVIGPNQQQRATQLNQLGIPVHVYAQAHQGLGSSLAYGISHCDESDGWLIALADMPYIQTQTIQNTVQQLQQGALIAAPYYQNHRGHPVGFSSYFKAELSNLHGDKGAQSIINKYPEAMVRLQTNDPGILKDIDRPSDIA